MMNNELKEILNRLDFNEWEVDLYKVPITWCEMYDIRDYIEKLEKQLQSIKFYIEQSDIKNMLWGKQLQEILNEYKRN